MSYFGYQQNPGIYQGMQQNALPQQQIVQANGKSSIDALRMAPNSSILIMDNTAPIVWLCTSDGIGNVTSVAYDITPHKEPAPIDVASLETRIAGIEESLLRLEEKINVKSNDESNRNVKNAGNDGKSWQNKGNGQ